MRYYSTTAGQMTLQADITAGSTSITVDTTAGLPVSFPYTLILDYGAVTEEVVDVTAAAGTTLTVTRGADGTVAQAHTTGAVIRHGVTARDLRESREHEAASAGVHGLTGTVVGTTDSQTLDNKVFEPGADHAPLTLRHLTGNTKPLLEVQDDTATKVAEAYSGGFRGWYSATEQDWNLYSAGAVNLWKRVIEVFLRSDRVAIVGRKITGATANFISFFDTDGTTALFSVDKDGNVAGKAVTASGDVSGANITTLTSTQASHTTTLADHESRITTNHNDISTNATNINDLNVNRITPAEDHLAKLPLKEAAGTAVTPAGGSVAVTFPVGLFTSAPKVTLGIVANSMPSAILGAYHSTPTTSGFTLYVHSSAALSGGAATVDWHAVQMS